MYSKLHCAVLAASPLDQGLELRCHPGVERFENFVFPARTFLVVDRNVGETKIEVGAREFRFQLDHCLVSFDRFRVATAVIESKAQVEMRRSVLWFDLGRMFQRVRGFVVLLQTVISITEILIRVGLNLIAIL